MELRLAAARGLVVVVCALAGCGYRPPGVVSYRAVTVQARLANGLRVLAVEEPGAEVVRVNIRIDVGADADPPGKAGLAHLVEHLLFQGRDGDGATWAAALDQVALRYRGETAIHSTEYVAAVRRDRLAALLAVEARRLAAGCHAVSPETFARELEVVRDESRLRAERSADNPRDRILAAIAPADHPWGRPTEGTASSLASMTREDVCAFLAAHYAPSRIVVVLSGDVRAREAVAEARRAFRKLSGGTGSPPPRPVPLRPHRAVLRDGEIMSGQRAVVLVWTLPAPYHRESAAVDLAVARLDGLLSSSFPARVWQVGGREPLLIASVALSPGEDVDDGLAAVRPIVDQMASPPSLGELQVLRDRRIRQLFEKIDGADARAAHLTEAFQRAGQINPVGLELEALSRVDPLQLGEVAGRLFSVSRATVVEIDPRDEAVGRGRPSLAEVPHDELIWAPAVQPAREPKAVRSRSVLDRARRFRLPNGLDLVVLPMPGTSVVSARLAFPVGAADDPPGQAGLAWTAARLALSRSPRGSSRARVMHRVWRNVDTSSTVSDDATTLSVDVLRPELEGALGGLLGRSLRGAYGSSNIAIVDRAYLSRAARAKTRPGWGERVHSLRAAVDRGLYGPGHPYAQVEAPWERRGLPISGEVLRRFQSQRYTARGATLVVAGDVAVADVRSLVEDLFDDVPPGQPPVRPRPPPLAHPGRVVIERVGHPADTEAAIEIDFPAGADPDRRAAREVLAAVLEDRLARLRDRFGSSLHVTVRHQVRSGSARYQIQAAVEAGQLDRALLSIEEALSALRAEGAEGLRDAFVRARRRVLIRLRADGMGARAAADRLIELAHQGALFTQARLIDQVAALRPADLAALVADELAPSREVLGLLGPRDALDAARRAAELPASARLHGQPGDGAAPPP